MCWVINLVLLEQKWSELDFFSLSEAVAGVHCSAGEDNLALFVEAEIHPTLDPPPPAPFSTSSWGQPEANLSFPGTKTALFPLFLQAHSESLSNLPRPSLVSENRLWIQHRKCLPLRCFKGELVSGPPHRSSMCGWLVDDVLFKHKGMGFQLISNKSFSEKICTYFWHKSVRGSINSLPKCFTCWSRW